MARGQRKKSKVNRGGKGGRVKLEEDELAEESLRQQNEELTAIEAIYQEDFRQISANPFVEYSITVRPHSVDNGSGEDQVSVDLIIRYVPAYPHKPPKLHVALGEGLSADDVSKLQNLLVEQAGALAREGRVMVFNLAETTQEFLSEHKGGAGNESLWDQMQYRQASVDTARNMSDVAEEKEDGDSWQHRIGSVDFSDWLADGEDEWDYNAMNRLSIDSDSSDRHKRKASGGGKEKEKEKKPLPETREPLSPLPPQRDALPSKNAPKVGPATEAVVRQGEQRAGVVPQGSEAKELQKEGGVGDSGDGDDEQLDEEGMEGEEESSQWTTSSGQKPPNQLSGFLGKMLRGMARIGPNYSGRKSGQWSRESGSEEDIRDAAQDSEAGSSGKTITESHRDFLLAQLLRLVCGTRGPLPNMLPVLASQMLKLGVLPAYVNNVVMSKPKIFDYNFRKMFTHKLQDLGADVEPTVRVAVSRFWEASEELYIESKEETKSRYQGDFKIMKMLGRGGFGSVHLCVNKLDGRRYAVKQIKAKDKSQLVNSKILREVSTLSLLQHHHIVRYYQAWIETDIGEFISIEEEGAGSEDGEKTNDWLKRGEESRTLSPSIMTEASDEAGEKKPAQSACLYIQMEYCPSSLRQRFDNGKKVSKEAKWRIFRQIVDGIQHIHSQGVVHRDLTPNNIFFSPLGDIKIGDFGLAKFTKLDEREAVPAEATVEPSAKGASAQGTSQVGTYYYTAPEIEQRWSHIDEKVDMYSLGIVCFELWHPFGTVMERVATLNKLKFERVLPKVWEAEFPQQATLVRWLIAPNPKDRPSAAEVLRSELLPPRMADEALQDILRTIQSGEDSSVYERVLGAIFDKDRVALHTGQHDAVEDLGPKADLLVGARDKTVRAVRTVFRRHGAQPTESSFVELGDDSKHLRSRNAVKLVDSSGNILAMRYGSRVPLAEWLANNQITSFKRYELSRVFRRGTGRSKPREFFQGDFDIIGGGRTLADAEVIKVAVEVVSEFPGYSGCEIRLNHRDLLNAVWSWVGIPREQRSSVAEVLAALNKYSHKSSDRKAEWNSVRRQLQRGVGLPDLAIDRLQTVERRLNGDAEGAISRLLGALPKTVLCSSALDELATLQGYLRMWDIDRQDVTIDALMAPDEDFYSGVFFQIHLKANSQGSKSALPLGCIAVGGRYDNLIQHFWHSSSIGNAPGAVGLSIGLAKLIKAANHSSCTGSEAEVLVCSKGGGGLLKARMQLVAELWAHNIKAEFLSLPAPSVKEQYEYANEQGIKWLVVITKEALSRNDAVKVRSLDLKMEEDIAVEDLIKFFTVGLNTPLSQRRKAALQRSQKLG